MVVVRPVRMSVPGHGHRCGTSWPIDRCDRQEPSTIRGLMRGHGFAAQHCMEPVRKVRVRIETEHCIRLRQLLGEFPTVPLGQTAHGDHSPGLAVAL